MLPSVAFAIDRFAIPVTHIARAPGDYDEGGRALPRIETSAQIQAVIQPIGRELQNVPEGKRSEARYLFWSRSYVMEDDIVVTPRAKCLVLVVFERDEGGFCKAALGRVK